MKLKLEGTFRLRAALEEGWRGVHERRHAWSEAEGQGAENHVIRGGGRYDLVGAPGRGHRDRNRRLRAAVLNEPLGNLRSDQAKQDRDREEQPFRSLVPRVGLFRLGRVRLGIVLLVRLHAPSYTKQAPRKPQDARRLRRYVRSLRGQGTPPAGKPEWWATISPMLAAAPAAQQILLSTPAGASGEFHRAWSSNEDWQRVQITADQCPRISPEHLAAERIRLGDALYRQEYFGAFVSAPGSVFDAEVLAHMFWR